MRSALSLVVPCYNEEHRLDLEEFQRFLVVSPEAELLFVDDGSTDGTRSLLEQHTAVPGARLSLLVQPKNGGKAEAVRCGMLKAIDEGATLVGFWDADLATPLDAIDDFLGVLRRRPEIDWVIGARIQLLGRDVRRRALRHYLGRVFATAASMVLDMPIYDTQCGAKIFRASPDLREVLSRPFLSRWVFDVEMIARFARIRARDKGRPAADSIFELPVPRWADIGGSKVKSTDFLKASFELLRIWRDRLPAVMHAPTITGRDATDRAV